MKKIKKKLAFYYSNQYIPNKYSSEFEWDPITQQLPNNQTGPTGTRWTQPSSNEIHAEELVQSVNTILVCNTCPQMAWKQRLHELKQYYTYNLRSGVLGVCFDICFAGASLSDVLLRQWLRVNTLSATIRA